MVGLTASMDLYDWKNFTHEYVLQCVNMWDHIDCKMYVCLYANFQEALGLQNEAVVLG